MKTIKELWSAEVYFPQIAGEVKFSYSNMEIKKRYPTVIETKHSYFTSNNVSINFFDETMLEKEYEISDLLTVFYSASEDKCIEWLNTKRENLIRDYKFNYERLLESKVKKAIEH